MKLVTFGSEATYSLFFFGIQQMLKPNNFRSEPHTKRSAFDHDWFRSIADKPAHVWAPDTSVADTRRREQTPAAKGGGQAGCPTLLKTFKVVSRWSRCGEN